MLHTLKISTIYYLFTRGDEGRPCHQECVGGCGQEEEDINSAAACTACNHTRNRCGAVLQSIATFSSFENIFH